MKTNFTMLRDLVMIYPITAKVQAETGIIVTALDKTAPQEGVVVAVGPGDTDKKGRFIPVELKPGDRVIFVKVGARELTYEKDVFFVVPATEVLCTLTAGSEREIL